MILRLSILSLSLATLVLTSCSVHVRPDLFPEFGWKPTVDHFPMIATPAEVEIEGARFSVEPTWKRIKEYGKSIERVPRFKHVLVLVMRQLNAAPKDTSISFTARGDVGKAYERRLSIFGRKWDPDHERRWGARLEIKMGQSNFREKGDDRRPSQLNFSGQVVRLTLPSN